MFTLILLIAAIVLLILVLIDKMPQKWLNVLFLVIIILLLVSGAGWIGTVKLN